MAVRLRKAGACAGQVVGGTHLPPSLLELPVSMINVFIYLTDSSPPKARWSWNRELPPAASQSAHWQEVVVPEWAKTKALQ